MDVKQSAKATREYRIRFIVISIRCRNGKGRQDEEAKSRSKQYYHLLPRLRIDSD